MGVERQAFHSTWRGQNAKRLMGVKKQGIFMGSASIDKKIQDWGVVWLEVRPLRQKRQKELINHIMLKEAED